MGKRFKAEKIVMKLREIELAQSQDLAPYGHVL